LINLENAKKLMVKEGIDCWLVHDFRGNNPVMWEILRKIIPATTRRVLLFIPAHGVPFLLVHKIDRESLAESGYKIKTYSGWRELDAMLSKLSKDYKKIAMEYSKNNELPMISWVDAGTIERMKKIGFEIVSSAEIFQSSAAVWSPEESESHNRAVKTIAAIKDEAFDFIRQKLKSSEPVTEYEVRAFILKRFREENVSCYDGPVVAADANSGNPHYEPSFEVNASIKENSLVLIDLWAIHSNIQSVFGDITWMGFVGDAVPDRYRKIFDIVAGARDAVVERLMESWSNDVPLQGWQLDDIARGYISDAGYGDYFIHRTGHSLGGGRHPHGLGANLDNFETHDTRDIIPGTGFTIEPGIYLPEYGIRSEINVYMDPVKGPTVTTPIQKEILRLV
jgi:Xaa-Pro dipeptidase